MTKSADAFRTISEVAEDLDVPKHVLRFWELRFPQIKPMKRGGGRRYYRRADIELLFGIKQLLHAQGYTIKGVQRILREHGIEAVKLAATGSAPASPLERLTADADGGHGPIGGAARRGRRKVPAAGQQRTIAAGSSADLREAGEQLNSVIGELRRLRQRIQTVRGVVASSDRQIPASRRLRRAKG